MYSKRRKELVSRTAPLAASAACPCTGMMSTPLRSSLKAIRRRSRPPASFSVMACNVLMQFTETGDIFTREPLGRFRWELHHATRKQMNKSTSRVASQLKHYEQAQFQHYRSK